VSDDRLPERLYRVLELVGGTSSSAESRFFRASISDEEFRIDLEPVKGG
jgi:hypothetical protein